MIRNNQNRRRRGGNNNGPRPQQMNGGNNYGNRLDNRQRGNASQLLEKYRTLARDAQQAGDRVTAEYYLQYADHYYRVLGDYRDKAPDQNRARRDSYDDDSAGFNGNDDIETDDEDDGDDRGEQRADDAPRADRQREDRPREDRQRDDRQRDDQGGWREDRPNGNRERNFRDGNRDNSRDQARDGGQREARREGSNRDRQGWNNDRNRDGNADRPNDRNGDRRPERRPEPVRAAIADADEGPIPGLPGPATLRLNRDEAGEPALRTERAPRLRAKTVATEVVEAPEAVEADAPKRRGRPRKLVDEATIEG